MCLDRTLTYGLYRQKKMVKYLSQWMECLLVGIVFVRGENGRNKSAIDLQDYYTRCIDIVQRVIKTPAAFYREMPKFGGLVEPLIFMVANGRFWQASYTPFWV